jgi:hypothetical protein
MNKIRVNRRVESKNLLIKCYICKSETTQLEHEAHVKKCKEGIFGGAIPEPDFYKYYFDKIKTQEMSLDELNYYNNKVEGQQTHKKSRRLSIYDGSTSSAIPVPVPDKTELKRKQRKKSMDDMRTFDIKQIRDNMTNKYFI